MTQDRVVSIADAVLLIHLKSSIGLCIADTFYSENFQYSMPILFYYKLIIARAPALGGSTTIRLTITHSVVRFCSSHSLVMALTTGNQPSKQSTVIQVSILYSCFQCLLVDSRGRGWSPLYRLVILLIESAVVTTKVEGSGKEEYKKNWHKVLQVIWWGMQAQCIAGFNFGAAQERYNIAS